MTTRLRGGGLLFPFERRDRRDEWEGRSAITEDRVERIREPRDIVGLGHEAVASRFTRRVVVGLERTRGQRDHNDVFVRGSAFN